MDILAIASEYILDITENKDGSVGTCPFCKEHSFSISTKKSMFYCFNCKCGGDAQKLVEMLAQKENLPKPE